MFLLEEILKNSKKHSQAIIVILLGIIAAGAIGGGLLIQDLNSIIAEREKLEGQRLALVEERYRTSLATKNLESKGVDLAIQKIELSTQASTSRIKQVANDMERLATSRKLPKEQQTQLLDLTKTLALEATLLSNEQENLRIELRQESTKSYNERVRGLYEAPRATFFPHLISVLIKHPALSVVLILILGGAVVLVMWLHSPRRRVHRHLGEARRILSQSGKSGSLPLEFSSDGRYERWLSENNLEFALDTLEELGHAQDAPQSFWDELTAAAEGLNLKERIAKYRRRTRTFI